MYMIDYHHHTDNSFDSKAKMEEVCEQAIKNGIKEICFTEHYSVNPVAPTYGHMDFSRYLGQINYCREKYHKYLTIKAGIELCEPHLLKGDYENKLRKNEFDFILGSIHNINNQKLRIYLKDKSANEVYRGYFSELYQLVAHADIDALAHFDLMKRYAVKTIGTYNFDDFKEIIAAILEKGIERGIGIEINTSGLNNKLLEETLPSIEVLKLYKDLGGELLTIGSDSHRAHTVGAYLGEAISLAKQAGFTHLFTYDQRTPKAIKIS
ncbi:histidinol-phosphatase HisJ family protein [Aquibacillus halophilus]|uniref:Histidinol-phosphatase n=1 Tax=Aquibacillus halophilus TaxID=930132 RepID=A0A6A8DF22_9BACI|nr:histidinol-phosphatase HisJ family protein [Aquibacillus halophilus]MRH44253.1 histidinol-phosphatase HisJ family protein [Aquibacillus halophilus]